MKNADGLIHNPFIPEYTLAGKYEAGDLEDIAESLRQEEAKILDFYVSRTGSDEAALAGYMKEDTKLSAEDMLKLGFATKILEPVMAYAYLKPVNKFNKMSKMTPDEEKSFWEKGSAIIAKALNLSRVDPIDQTLKDKDGKEFTLDKESGAPAVGDKASPDGSYEMANGSTVTISGGEVTAVKEAVTEDKTELELANAKIAELQALVDANEAVKAEAEAAKVEAENAKTEAEAEKVKMVALTTELQGLKNLWKPEARAKSNGTDVKVGRVNISTVAERRKDRISERETIKNK